MIPTSIKPGTMFGQDFEILQRLAQGGMGTVYVALQHSTGKKRALKVMHAQYEGDDQARRRFIQEARAGASIDSDHIVEMVGAGIDPDSDTPWIAMELLKGDDLKTVLSERKRLPRAEVLEIFRQICHALGKAHKMGLVHRDLKPENIFLATPRREGIAFTAKILDFGIAKLVRENTGNGTQTQAIGSPRWMSPEQADRGNAPISPATDVWALGLLAFNLLTGEVFWKTAHSDNPSVISQMCEILMDPIGAASERAAEFGVAELLPPDFDQWFARCVTRDVSARWVDADDALPALESVLLEEQPIVLAPRMSRTSTPARGLSLRPPPVSLTPSSGYSLDFTSAQGGEEPFSLVKDPSADTSSPHTVQVEAPTQPTRTRRILPIVLGVLGPLGIAAAVLIGLHRTPTGNEVVAHDASTLVEADAAMTTQPDAPSAPEVLSAPVDGAAALPTPDVALAVTPDVAPVALVVDAAPSARADAGRTPRTGPRATEDAGDPDSLPSDTQARVYSTRVLTQIRTHYDGFIHCYEQHATPGAGGHVTLHFEVRPDGSPTAVGVNGATPEVGSCIADIVRGMRLPTPVEVTSPIFHELRFHATQGEHEQPTPTGTTPAPTAAPTPAPTAPPAQPAP